MFVCDCVCIHVCVCVGLACVVRHMIIFVTILIDNWW